jgi:hypothetical protein
MRGDFENHSSAAEAMRKTGTDDGRSEGVTKKVPKCSPSLAALGNAVRRLKIEVVT